MTFRYRLRSCFVKYKYYTKHFVRMQSFYRFAHKEYRTESRNVLAKLEDGALGLAKSAASLSGPENAGPEITPASIGKPAAP